MNCRKRRRKIPRLPRNPGILIADDMGLILTLLKFSSWSREASTCGWRWTATTPSTCTGGTERRSTWCFLTCRCPVWTARIPWRPPAQPSHLGLFHDGELRYLHGSGAAGTRRGLRLQQTFRAADVGSIPAEPSGISRFQKANFPVCSVGLLNSLHGGFLMKILVIEDDGVIGK